MNRKITTSFLVLVLLCGNLLKAQDLKEISPSQQKLIEGFSVLMKSSLPYKNYKVIEEEKIVNFQSEFISYLDQEKTKNTFVLKQLEVKNNTISTLQSELANLQNTNITLSSNIENIHFLGMTFNKNNFKTSLWIMFFGFVFLLGYLYYKYKKANEITNSSKLVLRDLEDEYESFRRLCIEREQTLKRNFFDEMKKAKKLKNVS